MAPPTGTGPVVRALPDVTDVGAGRSRGRGAGPHLELVRPPRRLRPGLIGTVVICLTFTTLFALAALQAVLVQGQLHLDRLHGTIDQRQDAIDKLTTQVATLEAPDRIGKEAAAYGMVQPPDVVFLAPGTAPALPPTTTVPTAPAAEATAGQAAGG